MSDSVRPHRRQPTRLHHPWDSPGKNTGVGCHFLLQCMKGKSVSEVAQLCPTLSDPMDCSPPGSSIHGIFQARVLEWGAIAFSLFILLPLKKGSALPCLGYTDLSLITGLECVREGRTKSWGRHVQLMWQLPQLRSFQVLHVKKA